MQKKAKNALLLTGIIAGIAALIVTGTSKLLKFKRLVSFNITGIKKMDIVGVKLLQFPPDPGALRIIFDITVDNAVNEEYRVTVPYIRAYVYDSQIGNSIPRQGVIIIKASQRTILPDNDFRIPILNLKLLGVSKETVQSMIANRSLRLGLPVKFIVGLTINGIETQIEIPINI